jgi:predicted transposase/invertase (TIGR01784 family)
MATFLDPKSDLVFKKLFLNNKDLLISFINALLPEDYHPVVDIEYLPSEQVPIIPLFKDTIVDVKCKSSNGYIFIIEMQINWTDSFMQRVVYNPGKAYVQQLDKGEDYEKLLPVMAISIIDYVFDKTNKDFYHYYRIVNIKNTEKQIDGLSFVLIELPKFKHENEKESRSLQVLWLRFMKEIAKLEEAPKEFNENESISKAVEIVKEGGFSKAELDAYDKYYDSVSSHKSLMSGRYKEGIEEGIQFAINKMVENGTSLEDAKKILGID